MLEGPLRHDSQLEIEAFDGRLLERQVCLPGRVAALRLKGALQAKGAATARSESDAEDLVESDTEGVVAPEDIDVESGGGPSSGLSMPHP